MRRSRLAALLLPALAACAGAQSTPGAIGSGPTTNTAILTGAGGGAAMSAVVTVQPGLVQVPVAVAPAAAWRALPQALTQLGLAITSANEPSRLIVSQNVRVRRIADRRPSAFFHCGGSYSDDADSGNASVLVRVQVLPGADAASSQLRMELRASARPGNAATSTAGECGSTGVLERLIGQTVGEKAAATPS